ASRVRRRGGHRVGRGTGSRARAPRHRESDGRDPALARSRLADDLFRLRVFRTAPGRPACATDQAPAGARRRGDRPGSAAALLWRDRLEAVDQLDRRVGPVAAVRRLSAGLVTESARSEEHTSELQSRSDLVCRLLLEKKKKIKLLVKF